MEFAAKISILINNLKSKTVNLDITNKENLIYIIKFRSLLSNSVK